MRLPACVDSTLKRFFGPNWQAQSVLGGGRSQATLYRISGMPASMGYPMQGYSTLDLLGGEQSVVLKASRGADGLTLQHIHRYQRLLSVKLGAWVSSPLSWRTGESDDTDTVLIDEDGTCWEWMRWLPGSVIARVGKVTEQELRSVAKCLGAVHRESDQWGSRIPLVTSSHPWTNEGTFVFDRQSETCDTRLEDRVRRLRRVAKDGWSKAKAQGEKLAREAAQGLVPTQGSKLIEDLKPEESFAFRGEVLRNKLEWILKGLESRSVEWIRPLEQLAERVHCNAANECGWGHGDAWRGNWLFDDQQVSGLIDFGQAGFRWKGFDFARLFGSLISDTVKLPRASSAGVSQDDQYTATKVVGEPNVQPSRISLAVEAASNDANNDAIRRVSKGASEAASNDASRRVSEGVSNAAWEIAWEVYCGEQPKPGFRLQDAILMHRISTILTLELFLDRTEQMGMSRFDFDRLEEIVEMIEAML